MPSRTARATSALAAAMLALPAAAEPLGWTSDLEGALADAASEYRPVVAVFSSPTCGWCKQLKTQVLPSPEVAELLNHFVRVEIDVSEDRVAAARYGVRSVPAIRLMSSAGDVRGGHNGAITTPALKRLLGGALNADFLKAQPGESGKLLEKLAAGEMELGDWPEVLVALGDQTLASALRPAVLSLDPFPAAELVRMLDSPQLVVRLGALDLLEERAGDTFGFDPWGDIGDAAENTAAVERWRAWAKTGSADVSALYKELSADEVTAMIPELLSDNESRSAAAFRALSHGGDGVVSDLGHLIARRTDLEPLALRRLKAEQYALAMSGDLSAGRREFGRSLVFGTIDRRATAISDLPGKGGEAAIPILLEFLTDPEALLREAAVDALVKTGKHAIAKPLAAHLETERDRNVAYTILRGLGKMRSKRGLKALVEYIGNADEDLAIVAIEGVKRLGLSAEGAREAIIGALGDDRWRVRAAAVATAHKLKLREAVETIEKLLNDPDNFVQSAAIEALAALGSDDSFDQMAALFETEDSPKAAIIQAFASRQKVLPPSFFELLEKEEPEVLLSAIGALGRSIATNMSLIEDLVNSDDPDIAAAAVRIVASRGTKSVQGKKLLLSVLREGAPALQEAAVVSLNVESREFASLRGVSSARHELLAKKDPAALAPAEVVVLAFIKEFDRAQKTTTATLSERATVLADFADAVRSLTTSDEPITRFYAAKFLIEMGLPGGIEAADNDLETRTESERADLAYDLSNSSADGTLELLGRLLRDGSKKVRNRALYTSFSSSSSTPGAADLAFRALIEPDSPILPSDAWDNGLDSVAENGRVSELMREEATRILREGGSTAEVSLALFLVERSMTEAERELVEGYLRSDEPLHRRAAFRAFAKSAPKEFTEMVVHAAADPSPLVRAVVPDAFAKMSTTWNYQFDADHKIADWAYYNHYTGQRTKPAPLADAAREGLEKLVASADPKLRLDALLTLMSNGQQIDVDALISTMSQFPDRAAVESRIIDYLEDNHRKLDVDHYRRLAGALTSADTEDSEVAAVLRYFGADPTGGEIRLSLLDAPPAPAENLPPEPRPGPGAGSTVEDTPPPPEHLKVVFFNKPGCDKCSEALELVKEFRSEFADMELVVHDIDTTAKKELLEAMCERFNVPFDGRIAPIVFTSDGFADKDEVDYPGFMRLFSRTMNSPDRPGWDVFETAAIAAAGKKIESRYSALGLGVILAAGLLDGVNPCAFATIIFFMSYLQVARRSARQILQVGIAFILAVFLTYFVIGIGLLGIVGKIHASYAWAGKVMNWTFAALALLVMVLCIRDGILCLRGRLADTALQLPAFLKKRIHSTIRGGARHRRFVIAAFVVGVIISVLELACTGQVYLPITYMISKGESGAYLKLLFYNIAFIAPLVVIFALALSGMKSDALIRFQKKHTAAVKFATAAVFLALALFLIFHTLHTGKTPASAGQSEPALEAEA